MDLHDWIGTVSYALLALSYLVTNMYWLRALAIVALSIEVVYFALAADNSLWIGIAWTVVFIGINAVQLFLLLYARLHIRLSGDERALQEFVLVGLDKVDLRQFTKTGIFCDLADGSHFMTQGQPTDHVYFLIGGQVHIHVDEKRIATHLPGAFFGAVAYLTGLTSSVTTVSDQGCRCFRIAKADLADITVRSAQAGAVVNRLFASGLAQTVRSLDAIV